jgi:hypothetical protein
VVGGGKGDEGKMEGERASGGEQAGERGMGGEQSEGAATPATSRPSHEDVGQASGLGRAALPSNAYARMRPRPMALLAAFHKLARPQILVRTAPETLEYDPARHGAQAMLPVHQASPSAVLAEGCSRLLELERRGGGARYPVPARAGLHRCAVWDAQQRQGGRCGWGGRGCGG